MRQEAAVLGEKCRRDERSRTGWIEGGPQARGNARRWRPVAIVAEMEDAVGVSAPEQAAHPAAHGAEMAHHLAGAAEVTVLEQRQEQRCDAHRVGRRVADAVGHGVGDGSVGVLGVGEVVADLGRQASDIIGDEGLWCAGGEVVEPTQAFGALRAVGEHRVLVGGLGAQHGLVQTPEQRMIAVEGGAPHGISAHLVGTEGQALDRTIRLHIAKTVIGEAGLPVAGLAVAGEAILGAGAVEWGLVDGSVSAEDFGEAQREGGTGRDGSAHPRPTGEVASRVVDS